MTMVREIGALNSICLAVVNNNKSKVSNSYVARELGISFPTAQNALRTLAEKGLIMPCDKKYSRI